VTTHTNATTGVHGLPAGTRFLTASETILDVQIPSGIARDTEIPGNASFTLGGLLTKAFSELTNTPTTISGYGLTDVASISYVANHIASYNLHIDANIASLSLKMNVDGSNASSVVTLQSLTITGVASMARADIASFTVGGQDVIGDINAALEEILGE